jgi:putative membrane protein
MHVMIKRIFFTAPMFMLMMISSTWAQSDSTDAVPAHATKDIRFVMAASAAGQTEILASRMVDTHSQTMGVRAFAKTMIDDHTKANDQLLAAAKKDGYTVSSTPTQAQEAELSQLEPLKGAAFDSAYAAMMVKDHRAAVTLFQDESTSGRNSDIKAFAAQTLPVIQHHLAMANTLLVPSQ